MDYDSKGNGVRSPLLVPDTQEVQRGDASLIDVKAAAKTQGEAVPSAASRAQAIPDRLETLAGHWEGHACNFCCGRSRLTGLAISVLTFVFPFVTVGFNQYRLYGSVARGICWSLFFMVFSGFWAYFALFWFAYLLFRDLCETSDPDHCNLFHIPVFVDPLIVWALWWIIGLILATCTRAIIRKKLNIRGSCSGNEFGTVFEDCMLWAFCDRCAACQEARTLVYNNVSKGVWNGPYPKGFSDLNTGAACTCYDDMEAGNVEMISSTSSHTGT